MNSLFTIATEKTYKNGKNSPYYKIYRVCYDEETMKKFLRRIKFQYSQTYNGTGTKNDIETLQDFAIIDRVKSELDIKGRFGAPDIYHYHYRRYPAIYKILVNSLTADFFDLNILIEYYERLKRNGEISLSLCPSLISYLSNKKIEEIKQNAYFQTHSNSFEFYNDKEFKITREEYKEIIKNYFALIKLKHEVLNCTSKKIVGLATDHEKFLVYDDLFDDTLIAKKFRKI